MTPTLVSEMTHGTFQPLLNRLEQGGQAAQSGQVALRELLLACELGARVLDQVWELIQSSLRQGLEGGRLAEMLEKFGSTLEAARTSIYPKVRSVAAKAPHSNGELAAMLASLEEFEKRVVELDSGVQTLQNLLAKAPPKVDPALIANADAWQDGAYENLIDPLAQSGGSQGD